MFEKVNPFHPDKVADRIAGAITDLCYLKNKNPKVATEVLIGHGLCTIITETSEDITENEVRAIVNRIAGECELRFLCVKQDEHLAKNQDGMIRCGDNGIFKGCQVTEEQRRLSAEAEFNSHKYKSDGKYLITNNFAVICQSNMATENLETRLGGLLLKVNPIGRWTGGTNVDAGATNRKLGSDMGDAVTGGGLHGKDLSKADVSVNIYCHLLAQRNNTTVFSSCAIGDTMITFLLYGQKVIEVPYDEVVEEARRYIKELGGFEKFAEWGLIR